MPNFSLLSDTDSDSEAAAAVNDLLAQTKDLCVLEQVSAINCASFSADSILASDLESRFARLKSFPAAKPSIPTKPRTNAVSPKRFVSTSETPSMASSNNSSPLKSFPAAKPSIPTPKKPKRNAVSPKRFVSSSETSSLASSNNSSPLKPTKSQKVKDESASIGCTFWCSPKKSSSSSSGRKKEIREIDMARRGSDYGWSRNEELLEDLGSFSVEEQRKILRKAMAEQKKISSEARKLVKMGKKASVGKGFGGHVDEDELHSD